MILRIRQVSLKDAGEYQCEITFANKTIQSSARLTVIKPTKKGPIVISNGSDKSVSTEKMVIPNGLEIAGKCVKYTGDVCSAYLRDSLIFERTNHPLEKMNAQLEIVIRTLKNTNKLSKK